MPDAPACRYRWVVFDADGTLLDYEAAEAASLAATLAAHGLPASAVARAVFRAANVRLWPLLEAGRISSAELRVERFRELAAALSRADLDAERVSAVYLERLSCEVTLIPGAREVVERLAGRAELAIATNGIADTQRRRLAGCGLAPFIRVVVISDEVGAAKPAPAFFSALLERLGGPAPAEVLLVGDSPASDIAGGAAAGLDTCWFNPGGLTRPDGVDPTYEIVDLRELPALVEG